MTQSFGALQRLLTTEISVQESQLECLENILLLAGERSSSLPDPHHIVEGSAADRLLAELMGQEEKHQRVVPLVYAEVERIEHRMGRREGTPPSHLRLLCNELMDFAALQKEALDSLGQSRSSTIGFHIQATMASKLFDVLATKLELLRELQEGMIEHHSAAAMEAATLSSRQHSPPPAAGGGGRVVVDALASKLGLTDGATKGSMGQRMARTVAADGINALSSMLSKHGVFAEGEATSSIAARLMQHAGREGSTASSAASYKNAFHEAVLRTMMKSESPEQAVSDAVTRMQLVKHRSSSEESTVSSRSSTAEEDIRIGHGHKRHADDAATAMRRRRARQSASPSPSPNPATVPDAVVHRGPSHSTERPALIETAAVTALREELHELQGATGDLLSDANRIMSDCDDAVLQLGTENEALRDEIRRLRHAADSRRSKGEAIESDLEFSMAGLRKELHEARKQRDEAKQLVDEERRRSHATNRELSTLQDLHRSLAERCELQAADVRRLKESEAILCEEASSMRHAHQDALRRRDSELAERDTKIQALQLRVGALEQEASTSFSQLEATRKSVALVEKKLTEKQGEVKDVKLLFTQLEAAHREAKQEVHALRSVLASKDDALHRYTNLSRLKDHYTTDRAATSDVGAAAGASPPRPLKPSGSVLPSPAHGGVGGGAQHQAAASESVGPTRRGSHGRIVRLSFESPGRADSSRPPPATVGVAAPPEDVRPTSRGPTGTPSANVYKVLSDAAQLLDAIHRGKRNAHKKDPSLHHNDATDVNPNAVGGDANDNATPSLQAMNGSEEDVGYSAAAPTGAGRQPTQQLLHELELKERRLMAEAASLAEQERSVLDKRTVVSSTLLAQRNQMLMKNAPDEEVEALNNQISVVMERINQATGQIQQNKRTVEKKMDLLQRQRRVLLSSS